MVVDESDDLANFAARRRQIGDGGQDFERTVTRFQELGRSRVRAHGTSVCTTPPVFDGLPETPRAVIIERNDRIGAPRAVFGGHPL